MDRYSVMIDDDSPTCRICLDDSIDAELFSPCRCTGTTKYVHRTCLNEWRMEDLITRNRCEICLYDYKTEKYDRPKFIKFGYYNDRSSRDVIFRFNMCATLFLFIITNLMDKLDKNNYIISWAISDISTLDEYTKVLIYLNINLAAEISLGIIYIIIGSLSINNKVEFYKQMGGDFSFVLIMFFIVGGTIFLTEKYDISLIMFYVTNYLIIYKHIKAIYYLNKYCPDKVKEYDLNEDI